MTVVYRPARADELEQAEALVAQSINDLTERHGFGKIASARPPSFQLFSLADDPAGLWVAEESGETVGFAFSWVSDRLWFLAELFVSPAHQGKRIGESLLKLTLEHARQAGAVHRALITFAFNTVSQGLYVRHGLFPRCPMYMVSGNREAVMRNVRGETFRCVAIDESSSALRNLARVDACALDASREKHHRYLMNDGATRGALLYDKDDCVGYAYVGPDGHIGPLAVSKDEAMAPAFTTALRMAAERGSQNISAFLPGSCDAALGLAIANGLRITFPMVLMSTTGFGSWTRYLPRNPGFM
jgi:GNAT superfamily N-acetyltransferase